MKKVKDLEVLFEDEFYWLHEFSGVEDLISYLEINYNFNIHEFKEYDGEILSFNATTTIGDIVDYYETEYFERVGGADYRELLGMVLNEVV